MERGQPDSPRRSPRTSRNRYEEWFEALLFGSRWIAAPIYFGLIFSLLMLLIVFGREIVRSAGTVMVMDVNEAVLMALTFIDIALVANLVVIVILAGYENFVSKIDTEDHVDRPAWMGVIDFSGMKLKLFTSIVAITGIQLLKSFMALGGPRPPSEATMMWLIAVHFTFVVTTVLSALTDWLSARSKGSKT